jgi:chromosome partitioning protein
MPVISTAIGKGGTGKTTSTLVVGLELARMGTSVTLIDADPNKSLANWARKPGTPDGVEVIGDVSEETIIDVIEAAASRSAFVLVDCEGIQSAMVGYAISYSDLVLIPMQASQLDAPKAASMIHMVRTQEKVARRSIPYVLTLTRTRPAIVTGSQMHIERNLVEQKLRAMQNKLCDREAYRALFSFGGTLANLPGNVSGVDKAQREASLFTTELVEMLRPAPEVQAA